MTTTILLSLMLFAVVYLTVGLLFGIVMAAYSGTAEKFDADLLCLFAITWGWLLIARLWRGLKR